MNMGETAKEKEKGYMKKSGLKTRRTTRKAIPFSRSKFVSKKNGGCSHGMMTKVGRSGLEEETDGPKSKRKSKLPPCCSWYTGEMKKEVDTWAEAEREEQDRLYPGLEQQWRDGSIWYMPKDGSISYKQGLRRILARFDMPKEEEMEMNEEKDKAMKEKEKEKEKETEKKEKKVVVWQEEVEDEEAAAKCIKAMGECAAESLIRFLSAY